MTPQKIGGIIMIIIGILIILMGLFAEFIGLGDNDGIGWVQLLVAFSGVIFVIGGWDVMRTPE